MWNKYPDHGEQRDPTRIPIILDKLKQVWEKHPDTRLIQLLWAVDAITHDKDGFYLEDRDLEKLLDEFNENQF